MTKITSDKKHKKAKINDIRRQDDEIKRALPVRNIVFV